MAGERRYIPASEFCASVRDGTHDSPKPVQNGRKLVTSRHLTTGRLDLTDAYLISEEDFEAINKRSKVDRWDVLISMIGTVGEPCLIKEEPDFAIKNIGLFKTKSEADGKWLYYYLRSKDAQHSIREQSRGTTQQYIPLGALRDFPILVADDPEEQRAIAAVLGALDDKIELNRRMNATLEAMARALFQSWFVDFDPVRRNMDRSGNKSSALSSEASAKEDALFPDSFQDSELGPIPTGWEVKTVGDIGNVICGKTPPTSVSDYYGDDIPFITIPDMHGNVFAAATARKLSHAGANSQANKTLPPGSLCVSCIATPGLVVITSEDSQTNQQINSVVPHQKEETYFWYWVMTRLGAEIASSGSGGSVLVNLSKGRFETLQIIKPPHALIRAYHTTVRPLFEAILANTHQSRTLATLRDTLLPKLLSGKLRVSVALLAEDFI